jgi:predicted porin
MKNSIRTIALSSVSALALAALAGNASAASVDVYGWIHGTATYEDVDGASLQFGGGSDNNSGSRFGIRGSMDLAPGLTGVAQVEYGIVDRQGSADGSRVNLRLANAGLRFDDVGTLLLGSQWTMHYIWVSSQTDIFFGSQQKTTNAGQTLFRYDDAASFTTANMGGVQIHLAAQATRGSDDDVDLLHAAIRYSGGPVTVAASIADQQSSAGETFLAVAGTVDLGGGKVSGLVSMLDEADLTNWELAIAMPVTAEWTLKGKVAGFDGNDDGLGWGVEAAYSFGSGAFAYVGAGDADIDSRNLVVSTGFRVMF